LEPLNILRVSSVKTQLIYCLITSVSTCLDSQNHHQANISLGTLSNSAQNVHCYLMYLNYYGSIIGLMMTL